MSFKYVKKIYKENMENLCLPWLSHWEMGSGGGIFIGPMKEGFYLPLINTGIKGGWLVGVILKE